MNSIQLKGTLREGLGKTGVKQVRNAGLVPCVLYGTGVVKHFAVEKNELDKVVFTPQTFLIDLNLDGQAYQVVLRERQMHPIHDYVLHADFYIVNADQPIEVELPVRLVGSAEGVLKGGKLVQKQRRLRVRGLASELPASVEIDVTSVGLGRSLKVRDVAFEKFQVTASGDVPVASVEIPRSLRQEYQKNS